MLTPEEDLEMEALKKRGWSISAIARHTGRDRETVRAHLNGEREAGVRRRPDGQVDPFDRFEPCVRQRLTDDPHVWAMVLFDEVAALGNERAYPTFTRQLRDSGLCPHCEPCASSNGPAHVDIEHPPGAEVQWDWLELDDTPWGDKAYVLVCSLSHSSKSRGWFSESDDQAHLIVGIHEVLRCLGGTGREWRVDRMASQTYPTPRVTCRVEHDSKTSAVPVGWLVGCLAPAAVEHPLNRSIEVVDEHFEMHHRRWLSRLLGPDWAFVRFTGLMFRPMPPRGSRSCSQPVPSRAMISQPNRSE